MGGSVAWYCETYSILCDIFSLAFVQAPNCVLLSMLRLWKWMKHGCDTRQMCVSAAAGKQGVRKLHRTRYLPDRRGREGMNWCQQWHGRVRSGCRWSNELTLCSPVSPTAVATSRQQRRKERRKWIKHSNKKDRWWEWNAPLFLTIISNPDVAISSLCCLFRHLQPSFLFPVVLQRQTQIPPTGQFELHGEGLAVSNEIPSVRFQSPR